MAYAINKHEYTDIIKYELGGHRNREMIPVRSDKCLICKKNKQDHDKQPRANSL